MTNNPEKLKESVIEEFGLPRTIESYKKSVDIGLWKSEKLLIEKYFNKQESILDVGCGTGRTTLAFRKDGYNVTGVDIVPAMIVAAQKISQINNVKIPYEIGDATNLRFENESFGNTLFSFNGLTQIPGKDNRLKAIREIYRVLKPNGYFIFTSHIRHYFSSHFFTWVKEFFKRYFLKYFGYKVNGLEFGDIFFSRDSATQYSRKQYIHISSISEIKKMIEKSGFKLIYSEYRNTISSNDSKLDSGNCHFFICQKISAATQPNLID